MDDRIANIDLLFRNGLKDYEALPPEGVWDGIAPSVIKPRRSFMLLKVAASFAFIAVSGILTALLIRNMPDVSENNILTLSKSTMPGNVVKRDLRQPVNTEVVREITIADKTEVASFTEEGEPSIIKNFSLPTPGLYISFIKETFKGPGRRQNIEIPGSGSYQKLSGPAYSEPAEGAQVTVKENLLAENRRWSVGAMVAPTYYSQIDLSQNDAARDIISSEKAAFSYTGGLTFSYSLGSRFTVQTGLNYSSIGQKIDGISTYAGFQRFFESKGGSEFEVMTSSGTITSWNKDLYLSDNNSGSRVISMFNRDVFDPVKNNLTYISNSLSQNFNYVEVPVYLKYKFVDRLIDLKVIGGVSYNILVSNSAYATSEGARYYVGKTEGLSPMTLSSSLGMGMEYNFSGKLSLSFEPTFRYYITPLGGLAGSAIHPYSFGILSGISYKF